MLELLLSRAAGLQALLAGATHAMPLEEVRARHRVFAGVVRATGENLVVLQRKSGGYGAGLRWDH